ncbi:MAG TPA: hypothetical protein VND22_02235 [Actinomycetota bacterium]|nr:hypothetical protein [Actinomycetota bacterium]
MNLRPTSSLVRALFASQSILLITALIALLALTPPPPPVKAFSPDAPPTGVNQAPHPAPGSETLPPEGVEQGAAPGTDAAAPPAQTPQQPLPAGPQGHGAQNGRYRYHSTVTYPNEEPDKEDLTLLISTYGGTTEETKQIYRYGGADDSEYEVSWTVGGMKIQSMNFGFECNWEPDVVQIELPLSQGKSWNADSSCSETFEEEGQQETIAFRYQGSAQVVRKESVTIGGVPVDTFVIERKYTITTSFGPESGKEEGTETEWFSPERRMTVKQIGRSTASDPDGGTYEENSEIVLQKLDPE